MSDWWALSRDNKKHQPKCLFVIQVDFRVKRDPSWKIGNNNAHTGLPEKSEAEHIRVSDGINLLGLICVLLKMLEIIAPSAELSHRVNLEIGDFDRRIEAAHSSPQQTICSQRIHPLSIFRDWLCGVISSKLIQFREANGYEFVSQPGGDVRVAMGSRAGYYK